MKTKRLLVVLVLLLVVLICILYIIFPIFAGYQSLENIDQYYKKFNPSKIDVIYVSNDKQGSRSIVDEFVISQWREELSNLKFKKSHLQIRNKLQYKDINSVIEIHTTDGLSFIYNMNNIYNGFQYKTNKNIDKLYNNTYIVAKNILNKPVESDGND
ncbi:hypothetical protein RBG61_06485 [Paludicola sp. MB14-C6]|uniref:hypothetical protein n=1 Tax=Paludihabitans sp. MB14-C6 TaxID=3070656 RepID=UPI0027DD27A7|nr:hypothetical protein [Paludicola sp. MB14-C6]WMJ24308.1 hypothetical protein RBG61_06485 [Paludicola sp. MB14-C6]